MMPRHVALSLERDPSLWAEKHKKELKEVYETRVDILHEVIATQVRLNIPILTIFLLRSGQHTDHVDLIIDSMAQCFEELTKNQALSENQIKVAVLGKWYNLPGRLVDAIKCLIDETKYFDKFFLNLCVNYNGQQEIADACRLIAHRVEADKLDPEAITPAIIKEDLYSSYFIAPDLVIINGKKTLNSFMLWDISQATIYFTGKDWPDFKITDFKKAVDLYGLLE